MTLFTKAGCYPTALPFKDVDDNGDTWTNLEINEAGRTACGWTEAPDAPTYDSDAATLSWADGAWLVTPLTTDELTANLSAARSTRLSDLAALRWEKMQIVQFNGQAMPADDVTVGRCVAAKEYAAETGMDLDALRNWKLADGVWIKISTSQIAAYGVAIGTHWQACFDQEEALSGQIVAAPDLATLRAIDITTGWPA